MSKGLPSRGRHARAQTFLRLQVLLVSGVVLLYAPGAAAPTAAAAAGPAGASPSAGPAAAPPAAATDLFRRF
ncbi:MAG TPA: hypothetical protein VFQ07_11795, partial [Candidatus Polarisedimenticolia bacterium]|nr:hypothetical protein [Candidatus Polarisedimenticolia bacterium]